METQHIFFKVKTKLKILNRKKYPLQRIKKRLRAGNGKHFPGVIAAGA
jgi:hypothetical protein